MRTWRDTYMRSPARVAGWLRLEALRRVRFAATAVRRLVLRCLQRDGGLALRARHVAGVALGRLPRAGGAGRHQTRCRASGRARQVSRKVQLARMHFRALVAEGSLPHVRLGRRR